MLDVYLHAEYCESAAANPALVGTYDLPHLSVIITKSLEGSCGRTPDGRPLARAKIRRWQGWQ